jgi:hypothetical protein
MEVRMMSQEISIFDLSGGEGKTLSGAILGKLFYAKLLPIIERQNHPQPLFLNFAGLDLVTSSFFREGILAFRDYCVNNRFNLYPIIANITQVSLDELDIALEVRGGDAIIVCRLESGEVIDARVVGPLEEKQQLTLEAVLQVKEADAATLLEKHKESEGIGITGWNNRLAALAAKGLLIEFKKGRGKLYRPVVELG